VTAKLRDAQAFTRGFLLAMDWANSGTRSGLEERVPRLAGEDVPALYGAFRALPEESRQSMRITWAKREPLQRIDGRLKIHSSWMTELLSQEQSSTLLLALGELPPEMGRKVLRALWPKVRPSKPEDSVGEMKPLQPALAGHLRRRLFANFVRVSDSPQAGNRENDRFGRLLDLDRSEVWLLCQELGRSVQAQAESAADPSPSAIEHLRVVREIFGSEDSIVGHLGLRLLALALAAAPRSFSLSIAQQMARPIGQHLLTWRDESDRDGPATEQSVKEVLEKVDLIMDRRKTDTPTE